MNLELGSKVALVCASSAGIGKAIAQGLAQEGAHISLLARNGSNLEKARTEIAAVAKGRVLSTVCDLSRPQDISRAFEATRKELGPIDILINNQGGPMPGNIQELTDAQFESGVDTNLKAVFHLTKLCLPSMKERGFGRILNILSISAKEPLPNLLLSNMFRPAILGLAKTLAKEYAPFGITVNSLLPAFVMTQRLTGLLERQAGEKGVSFEEAVKSTVQKIPMGRIAEPEEFARLAVFLSSPKASYITGSAIAVDGGASQSLY